MGALRHTTGRYAYAASRTVTHYKYLYALENGGFVVSKRSFKQITAFYERDAEGRETRIVAPGIGF